MFKNKETKVILLGGAKKTYLELKNIINVELNKGKKGTDYQKILKGINRVVIILKENPHFGIQIQKNKIPQEYLKKYKVSNLWKCDIYGFWRIIYWIDSSNKVNIISFVLDIIDHKIYNKKFQYKKH